MIRRKQPPPLNVRTDTEEVYHKTDQLEQELQHLHQDMRRSTLTKWVLVASLLFSLALNGWLGQSLVDLNKSVQCRDEGLAVWADEVADVLTIGRDPASVSSLRSRYNKCKG